MAPCRCRLPSSVCGSWRSLRAPVRPITLPAGMQLSGHLDREALRRALDRIVARHEALRTSFARDRWRTRYNGLLLRISVLL